MMGRGRNKQFLADVDPDIYRKLTVRALTALSDGDYPSCRKYLAELLEELEEAA